MHETASAISTVMPFSGIFLAEAPGVEWTPAAIRFVHMLAAIIAAGAAIFQWWAVHPALARFDGDLRRRIREAIVDRWRPVVLACIVLLLATGLATYLMYRVPALRGHANKGLYHALIGVKMIAALGVFHCATVLILPGAKGQAYRDRARVWLTIMVVLLLIVIALGSALRALSPTNV